MKMSATCMRCVVDRQEARIHKEKDEEKKAAYMRRVMEILAKRSEVDSTPVISVEISRAYEEFFGPEMDFTKIKKEYNRQMMELVPGIEEDISGAADPLERAILYARVGNYIDYGAMEHVDGDTLQELIQNVARDSLDSVCYQKFCEDMNRAKRLVYLTDNCGEVVLDKLLVKRLKECYPQVEITVLVRGLPVVNDATREDALMVGLDEVAAIEDNGTDIGGTSLKHVKKEARELIEAADVLIAKGQGNFESLKGCGLNLYYLFLCKCDWFVEQFGLTKNTGVFMREKDWQK